LVREALNNFETVAKARKISIKEELPRKLPEWKTDPDLAVQILINLIDHALQFAKKEAKVIVKADGKEIQITVMDDGPHIPNEEPGVIFNKTVPIYRPLGSVGHRGTGLILAICKEKARWLHGRMCVENHPDGAKVHLILPK
ncbi:MAG: HAMP domain-containing sensor histidine kinase, partial [bacterium]|nr:HAMP domain-containing sensor histidine kinase [bacterium]